MTTIFKLDSDQYDRFVSKLANFGSDDLCWEWTGARYKYGYGKVGINKRTYSSHRIAAMLWVGPNTDNLQVCHHCDNPPCCNPAHLFYGTQSDNINDAASKGRNPSQIRPPRGISNGRSKLNEGAVREIHKSSETTAALARKFGVTHGAVSHVRKGRHWTHIAK